MSSQAGEITSGSPGSSSLRRYRTFWCLVPHTTGMTALQIPRPWGQVLHLQVEYQIYVNLQGKVYLHLSVHQPTFCFLTFLPARDTYLLVAYLLRQAPVQAGSTSNVFQTSDILSLSFGLFDPLRELDPRVRLLSFKLQLCGSLLE